MQSSLSLSSYFRAHGSLFDSDVLTAFNFVCFRGLCSLISGGNCGQGRQLHRLVLETCAIKTWRFQAPGAYLWFQYCFQLLLASFMLIGIYCCFSTSSPWLFQILTEIWLILFVKDRNVLCACAWGLPSWDWGIQAYGHLRVRLAACAPHWWTLAKWWHTLFIFCRLTHPIHWHMRLCGTTNNDSF